MRFDVHALIGQPDQLVVDVQSDLLSDLTSRVVIPLLPLLHTDDRSMPRLKPVLTVLDAEYLLLTTDIGSIPKRLLTPALANLEADYRDIITDALDFLFQGF